MPVPTPSAPAPPAPPTLTICAWPDPVLDTMGYDPRSSYVETFWLSALGPTALLLLRHLANRFDTETGMLEISIGETSRVLGLGAREGTSSPLRKCIDRLTRFDLACSDGLTTHAVRRNLPALNPRHVKRLPTSLQHQHEAWLATSSADDINAVAGTVRRPAFRLAFVLFEQGNDPVHVERTLLASGFHPAVCREGTRWAYERHSQALAALESTNTAA